jgi:hypothetical protein
MISKDRLNKAAKKGIISPAQVEPLLAFLHKFPAETGNQAHEPLKFVRSFGDIFIAFGIGILVLSISQLSISTYQYLFPIAGFLLLAEWLVGNRRLALPGMAILVSIIFLVHQALSFNNEQSTMLGLGLTSATSLLFYLRYKMPFSLLPFAGGLVFMAFLQIGADILATPIIISGLGAIIFSVAMWFDIRDTKRQNHLSDSAFWLHLLASPLIVHGVMLSMLLGDSAWVEGVGEEMIIIIFFIGFLLLALLLDRRAMLISTQIYMIYALTQLIPAQFNNSQNVMIYILMGLGLIIIFFGTFWYKTRHLIFGFMSGTTLSHYVPEFIPYDNKPK